MRSTKVIAMCIFNELMAAGLFPALDGTSMRTDPSISGRKYRKSVYNTVFFYNESLNVVSAAAKSAFQLKHTPWLLRSICPAGLGYQIRTIQYGKILVMLLYRKYYWRIYEVYNNTSYVLQWYHVWIDTGSFSIFHRAEGRACERSYLFGFYFTLHQHLSMPAIQCK